MVVKINVTHIFPKMYVHIHVADYRIAGDFGEVFKLATWRVFQRSTNLKSPIQT